jgi:hypothetical protein
MTKRLVTLIEIFVFIGIITGVARVVWINDTATGLCGMANFESIHVLLNMISDVIPNS